MGAPSTGETVRRLGNFEVLREIAARMNSTVLAVLNVAMSMVARRMFGGVEVTGLGDGLYRLTTDQGAYTTNSLAFVGEDGVLLVDTQAENDADAVLAVGEALSGGQLTLAVDEDAEATSGRR